MAAIKRDRSTSPETDEHGDTVIEQPSYTNPIPISPTLDMNSVKTTSPRRVKSTKTDADLDHCPVYYPTIEEFKDPMAYMRTISDEAKEYGICKIVPPEEWKMPFVTDTEKFRFKTRLQRLNNIEASCRAKLNFLEQLYQFHRQQGNPRVAVPTINHKPLDLWLLRKEVQKLGGYQAVVEANKWADLGRVLGYTAIRGLSAQIKNSYIRVILPFEDFFERSKNVSATTAPNSASAQKPLSLSLDTTPRKAEGAPSSPSSPMSTTSSPLSEPPDENESKASESSASKARRAGRMSAADRNTPKKPVSVTKPVVPPPRIFNDADAKPSKHSDYFCEVCQKANRDTQMLLCDGCDCGYHTFCLDPPLDSIPKGEWFCFTCIAGTGGDFGFDEGEEHCLSSFQARDREFRRRWFASHPPAQNTDEKHSVASMIGKVLVSEDDIEREFWRLTQSAEETVEIEYGADVHSTTHGSAMPTMETQPSNPYSSDPWNLNNIPILQESLLRYIKSDISGMTVPWTYVGMTFSTFCWHNEDHYTYSINFMHWGETKTWYGIPGDDAEKFEAAIKNEAPDLFEAQPDLLFQLVTLMNPKRVAEAGVRVFKCNQRAGEFVVTFPKAYHAGFNHGLNFNEAVNFALPDWLSLGRECALHYATHRKHPVFSHDELLVTITQHSQSIKTALWLVESLREMVGREHDARAKARELDFQEISQDTDLPEDQYQCTVCKVFCYLSQITCQCQQAVVCIEHHQLLGCSRHVSGRQLTLRKRYSDATLTEILAKVDERAEVPEAWKNKFNRTLSESSTPNLRSLRALLAEGDRISHPIPELPTLRKCVESANTWVESANAFLSRKHTNRKRSRRSRGSAPGRGIDDVLERPEHGLPELYALLESVKALGFDAPEIASLQTLGQQSEGVKARAIHLLSMADAPLDRTAFLKECERLVLEASSMNINIEELVEVDKVVLREQLLKQIDDVGKDTPLTPEEVRSLVQRARACNVPVDALSILLEKQKGGEEWQRKAKALVDKNIKSLEDLEEMAAMDPDAAIDPVAFDRIQALRARALDFEKQAQFWLAAEPGAAKPTVQEVLKLACRAEKEFVIVSISDLRASADIALELESRCESVLKLRYDEPIVPGEIFRHIEKWAKYADDHLRAFQLPNYDKLAVQVARHTEWIAQLPWYCQNHKFPHVEDLIKDVLETTKQDDDAPPADDYVTCICLKPVRPPPAGESSDAVQCDHCFARFHGTCAASGGSCLFCDQQHWDGTLHQSRKWHFSYLPPMLSDAPDITKRYSEDWKNLELLVHRVDRLSAVIGQFLSYASRPENQSLDHLAQIRHYMRKLFRIQFPVSPMKEISFGLDLSSLHRSIAGQPTGNRVRKRRRPRFTFGPDLDDDWKDGTRCVCRGRARYPHEWGKLKCSSCNRDYHTSCVFFKRNAIQEEEDFVCPLCCVRKGKRYKFTDVRVTPPGEPTQNVDTCIDTQEMLESFSREVLYMQLPKPQMPTLYVELVRFVPGQPDSTPVARPPPAVNGHYNHGQGYGGASSASPGVANGVVGTANDVNPSGPHGTLQYPYPRWMNPATPAMPPVSRYLENAQNGASGSKRKFVEDEEPPMASMRPTSPPTAKRRTPAAESVSSHSSGSTATVKPQGHNQTGRQSSPRTSNGTASHQHSPAPSNQSLSPSLRMIVSPSNHPIPSTSASTADASRNRPMPHPRVS